ncbi:MAG: M28 family peptidase [Xanthomonadales bacterium]
MLKLRHPVSLLLITLLILLGVLRGFSTPAPNGADVPDVVFSAVRAEAILAELLQEGRPHVAGSAANRVVRDRALGHLEAAGYEPEVQSLFHCSARFGACSRVENIIAVKPGRVGRDAVLLTAHYDSVWAGPGASDDGAGVAAILEIARMAADFPPFDNDVIFLLSDSEENGLLGAEAFARHHPAFARVKAVINLEARGVTGPSFLFETGAGNRSLIRLYAKNVPRPVANSLVYEIYQTLPNDTDFSVYREAGVTGFNFAFANGVAAYHSAVDDANHIDLGSLQHHGDNAWSLLQALGDRNLRKIDARENAGYIDIFGMAFSHYPESITGGLALFLGVWVMIAIAAAFRREFRYRQLRWGLLAIPLMILALVAGGWLLSFPLGRWLDQHPLEHPYPWAARGVLLLYAVLVVYAALKLFSGRVSACAWMILAWFGIFVLAMALAARQPGIAHIGLIPLALFALGSIVDIVRKKSPAPLLVASLAGFAGAAFMSLHHFILLDGVVNFGASQLRTGALVLVCITAMPMLLAFVRQRELDWRPVKWGAIALLGLGIVHVLLPAYTPERPRDMTLMYREVAGRDTGHLVVESNATRHDSAYATSHDFERTELNDGLLGTTWRPARVVKALDLPGIALEDLGEESLPDGRRYRLNVVLPFDTPLLQFAFPPDSGLRRVWFDGELALDTALRTKRTRRVHTLRLVNPPRGSMVLELETASSDPFTVSALSWHALPAVLTAPFLGNWPDEARACKFGPRAEKVQTFEIGRAP